MRRHGTRPQEKGTRVSPFLDQREPGRDDRDGRTGLPRAYTRDLYEQKCSAVFEHVYESYPERDAGVYTEVA